MSLGTLPVLPAPRAVGRHAMTLALAMLWLWALASAAWGAPPRPTLALTEAEHAWVAQHPVIRVGVSTEFPPYYFSVGRGRYEGFVVDLMDRLAARAGLAVEYHRFDRFGDTLEAVKRGEIDVTPFTSQTNARSDYLRFVRPMFTTQMVFVGDRRFGDLSPTSQFDGYRVAVEKHSTAADLVRERMPKARVQEYDSSEQAVLATASGDADVFVGFRQVAVYYMIKHFTANLGVRGTMPTAGTALGPAVRKDLPELHAILDKAVVDLTTDEIAEVASKWLPRGVLGAEPAATAELSAAQKGWVKAHGAIRVGFDAGFSPIAFKNATGGFDGLAADITRALTAKVGLIGAYQEGASFAEVFERARRGELDVVVAAARNPERARDFDFVGPFISVPTVIVASNDSDLDVGLDGPGPKRLALLKEHFLIPLLRSRHPRITLQEYASQAEVLGAVRRGQADLAIGNMKVVNQLIEAGHQGALRTVGIVPNGDSELYFAVRKTLPELAPVLRTALDALRPAEMAAMEGRWLRAEYSSGVPWARVLMAAAGALTLASLVIGSLWYGNRRLRLAQGALDTARRVAEEQAGARAGFIAYLSHELRGSLGGLAAGLQMMEAGSIPVDKREKLLSAMQRSAAGLLELCERTLDFERTVIGGVDLQPTTVRPAEVIEKALAPWQMQAELKGLRLQTSVRFDRSTLAQCDAVRLTQVLQNIVGNAVKFTVRGTVEVEADLRPLDGQRALLTIAVTDTGPGIAADDRERLFAPFVQGRSGRLAGGGAGLGLSITQRIVLAMQGTVRLAHSTPAGSRFEAGLPVQIETASVGTTVAA
jgi:two-component system, NarL family, sensor histidine kinase EvgS